MRLAVDGKRLVQPRTGPARWLEHMLQHWAENPGPFSKIRVYTPGPTSSAWAATPEVRHVPINTSLPPILWENLHLRRAASSDDVLFGSSYTIPVGFSGRSVVSIQGIYEGEHAEPVPWWHKVRYSALYAASAKQADLVLANSESTKNDVVQHYGVDPDRIRVIYQGVGPPFGWKEDREEARREAAEILGHDEPYFLFVGKMSPRRHVPELLRAFREVRDQEGRFRLVLVGPNHRDLDLDKNVRETGVSEWMSHFPHLDQPEIATLYSAATAFVLPTTHEGLSATILEAMACGAPVITADHATIHEGFADDALVVEAPKVDLLTDAMLRLARDEELAESLSRGGREVASEFSWERTARRTMQALVEVATA